jgi:hypothetical protein
MKQLISSPLADLLISRGVRTIDEAFTFISKLSYGRNSNRFDFGLVVEESRGTCSSKHAFLKSLLDEQKIEGWEMILGMFKMNKQNTPAIYQILEMNGLDYIPEAHTYLKFGAERYDLTHPSASFNNIKDDIIEEVVIDPSKVTKWKVDYHKRFIKSWVEQSSIIHSFEEIWKIREICIVKLSE